MSKKNITNNDGWPPVHAIVLLSPGTRLDCSPETVAIIPEGEIPVYGMVVEHVVGDNWQQDRVEVLVDSKIYRIMRTPSSFPSMDPYFNVKVIQ